MSKGKVLFQLSGSIACFKACQLISLLVKSGYEVEVVATPSALRFVGEATLEGLTGRKVHTDLWEAGEAMQHIHLIRRADIAVICPATANTINKLASGSADDLLSTLFLAHDFSKPFLIAPAMNASMWRHPATQASIKKLRGWGVQVLESGFGALACGEVGEGRLLEPDEMIQEIENRLAKPERRLRVLVTSGGTTAPIDDVRAITNFSTGRTGAFLAEFLASRGHEVTLLRAESAPDAPGARSITFRTFEDLERQLTDELGTQAYDAVIHAAAVSDFSVKSLRSADGARIEPGGKIESGAEFAIHLQSNPKLVDRLRALSKNSQIMVVAFKLTSGATDSDRGATVAALATRAKPDLIVQNDLSELSPEHHPARIHWISPDGKPTRSVDVSNKSELAAALESALLEAK